MYHILKSQQFSRGQLEKLFADTDKLERLYEDPDSRVGLRKVLEGKLMFAVFYEPSTRTGYSFCAAAHHLGMTAIWTQNAKEFSSAIKGETLEDTIHVLCQYDPNVIVIRHSEDGAAERAAAIVDRFGYKASIVNAGDGKGQHPTQALLDLYTIKRELGRLDDLVVTIGGDLANGRTVRSLVYLLSKFEKIRFIFLSPENLRIKEDILEHLREHDIAYSETESVYDALTAADIIYWTRIQKERGSTNDTLDLSIGVKEMELIRPSARLLHPLPRVNEISTEIDDYHRSAYLRQVRNGMFIRMMLLKGMCR